MRPILHRGSLVEMAVPYGDVNEVPASVLAAYAAPAHPEVPCWHMACKLSSTC